MTFLISSLILAISIVNKDKSVLIDFRFTTKDVSYAKQLYELLSKYIRSLPAVKLPLKFKISVLLSDDILSYNLKVLLNVKRRKQIVIPHNIKKFGLGRLRLPSGPLEVNISSKVINLPRGLLKQKIIKNAIEGIFLKIRDLNGLCLIGPVMVYNRVNPMIAKIELDGNLVGYSPVNLILIRDFSRNHTIRVFRKGYKPIEYTLSKCQPGDDKGVIIVFLKRLKRFPKFFIGFGYPFYLWFDNSRLRYSDAYLVFGTILPHDLSIGVDVKESSFLSLRVFGNVISLMFYDTALVHLPTGGMAVLRTYYDSFSLLLGLGLLWHIGDTTKLIVFGEAGPTWSYARNIVSSLSPSFMGGIGISQHIFGKFYAVLKASYFYVPKMQTTNAEFDIWGISEPSVREISFKSFLFSLGFEITI